ncbi:MAG: hypothetical protein L6Q54_15635, partial [Leptospiraceae bacterium]|nr:hypothetical protein [Leptospiraceae bacterium]
MFVIILNTALLSQPGGEYNSYGHHFNYLSINQYKVWASNNGNQFISPSDYFTGSYGLFWPAGENAYKKFSTNFLKTIWFGNLGEKYVMPRYSFTKFLKPGPIELLNNDVKDPDFRVFKIRKFWEKFPFGAIRDNFELDYNEWPVQFGAPWEDRNNDGVFTRNLDNPKFLGDEQLWHVSNFGDSTFYPYPDLFYGDALFKIEQHTLIYAFNRSNFLKDVILINLKFINKDLHSLDSCFILLESALLPGSYLDTVNASFAGIDTLNNLIFCYNRTNYNIEYGAPSPAGGLLLLNSSKDYGDAEKLPIFSFTQQVGYDTNYHSFAGVSNVKQYYNFSRGLLDNGDPIISPITGEKTRFLFTGDPLTKTGWLAEHGITPGINKISIGSQFRTSL